MDEFHPENIYKAENVLIITKPFFKANVKGEGKRPLQQWFPSDVSYTRYVSF